jgi:predicted DNA-binding transcriptional regulator YafY
MRADRLVALLLILQRKGRVTAAEVAEELEVSERTARRDLDALSMAGVPVYSQQGRNGGWQLLGGGRTDLSGLTAAEARALFLVAGPASATPEVRTALRKLVRALPEPMRDEAEAASAAVVVADGWGRSRRTTATPAWLPVLQRAVVEAVQVELAYVAGDGAETVRTVHPLGLAARGSIWYLMADTAAGLRTFRIDRVKGAAPSRERAVRPDGFDLEEAWARFSEEVQRRWHSAEVRGLARPDAMERLQRVLGTRLLTGPPAADGRIEVAVTGPTERAVVAELAGFGAMVEITDPPAAREAIRTIGAELAALYPST